MKAQRLALALTAINLLVLLYNLARPSPAPAQPTEPIVRARRWELVDGSGRVRSRLSVEASGEVVLRLMDQNGTIRVKLGAGTDGSGLLLADETTAPGIHIIARRSATPDRPNTTSITLVGTGGQRRVITAQP